MKVKNSIVNQKQEKKSPKAENKSTGKRFSARSVLTGSFLEKEGLIKQIPFILYISLLFLLYIANSFYGEKTIFEIEKYKSELIELRSEYISAKTRLMTGTNLSKVSEKLKPFGVLPSHTPPGKVFVKISENE